MKAHPDPDAWTPVLTPGDGAEAAWAAIHDIAAALRGGAPEGASLAGGSAGEALFFAYLAGASDAAQDGRQAEHLLDHAVDALARRPMTAALYSGFGGVAWAVQHLLDLDPGAGEDQNLAIDDAVLAYLTTTPRREDYDVVGGLAGLGLYTLDRLPRPAAAECLSRVVDRLATLAEPRGGGVTLHTPPARLLSQTAAVYPRGYYNLGVAHGVPGVLPLLAAACAAGVARARPLLDGMVAWALAQELPEGAGSRFPTLLTPDQAPADAAPSRAAWCYGDPGIAAALLWAARTAGEPAWEAAALRVAQAAAQRSLDSAGVRDAGLCHGSAGLGLLFNRLYQATGEDTLREAARAWYEQTLAPGLRRPGEGVAGYLSWGPRPDGTGGWIAERGLLTGAAGVGLSLLAAVSPIEPRWDRMLLTAVPPRPVSQRTSPGRGER
jgi:hypothetical protein